MNSSSNKFSEKFKLLLRNSDCASIGCISPINYHVDDNGMHVYRWGKRGSWGHYFLSFLFCFALKRVSVLTTRKSERVLYSSDGKVTNVLSVSCIVPPVVTSKKTRALSIGFNIFCFIVIPAAIAIGMLFVDVGTNPIIAFVIVKIIVDILFLFINFILNKYAISNINKYTKDISNNSGEITKVIKFLNSPLELNKSPNMTLKNASINKKIIMLKSDIFGERDNTTASMIVGTLVVYWGVIFPVLFTYTDAFKYSKFGLIIGVLLALSCLLNIFLILFMTSLSASCFACSYDISLINMLSGTKKIKNFDFIKMDDENLVYSIHDKDSTVDYSQGLKNETADLSNETLNLSNETLDLSDISTKNKDIHEVVNIAQSTNIIV